jgi:hypothetical protein
LEECNISVDGARKMADVLRNNTPLKRLVLRKNQIDFHGVQYIADALSLNKTLEEFCLEELPRFDINQNFQANAEERLRKEKISVPGVEDGGAVSKSRRGICDAVMFRNFTLLYADISPRYDLRIDGLIMQALIRNWRIKWITEKYPEISISTIMNGDQDQLNGLDPDDLRLIATIRQQHDEMAKSIAMKEPKASEVKKNDVARSCGWYLGDEGIVAAN